MHRDLVFGSTLALAIVACGLGCGSGDDAAKTTSSGAGGGAAASGAGGGASSTGGTSAGAGGGGAGGGAAASCDPESYVPDWAKNAVPDTEIYVSPSGDDGNDGSKGAPLKTTAAAMQKFAPGVRLDFMTGTYGCNLAIQGFAGSRQKPGIIRSVDGPRKAVFACNPNDTGIYMSKSSGIVIDGIELYGNGGHGIQLDSGSPFDPNALSHDVVIHASYIHDPACAPIKMSQAAFIWVVGNEFSHPGTCNQGTLRQDVEFVAVDDTVVVGNDAHDGGLFDEVKGGAERALIAMNRIHDDTNGILVGGDGTGYPYLVHTNADYEATKVVVWGNTIALPGAGSEAFRIVACHDCLVANNTFYADAPKSILRVLTSNFGNGQPDVHNQNVRVVNNVFAMGSKASLYAIASNEAPDVLTMTHNLWYAADGSLASTYSDIPFLNEPSSIYDEDPELAAPPADLTPKPGSPVVGKGIALPEVPGNADGACRSGPPDIGAY